ncbi:MAG: type II toxin-antitoxin system VapC family toxin [Bacteroidales bacterium]|nr:type II toxin-antitoxin system VapC family toxin [Bacteroidales bacterium]
MEQRYLIDTNVVIDYFAELLPEKTLNKFDKLIESSSVCISVITKIELLGFKGLTAKERKLFNEFIDLTKVLNLSDKVVEQTIKLRTEHKIKLPDAIIAATAITSGLALVTRNTKDFIKIRDIELINPNENW